MPNSDEFNETSLNIEIVVGTNEWNAGGTRYNVSDIIVHDGYSYGSSDYINDIALVRVRSPIQFNERVQPITYTANEVPPGTKLQSTGWGRLSVGAFFYIVHFEIPHE